MKIYIVVTDVVNDVTYSRKSVVTRVVIRFYDMTLSTGKQRRHMIKGYTFFLIFDPKHRLWVLVRIVSTTCTY